ncbi:hypothetical protein ACFL2E_13035 [Thermodesulfobacteriota bacterium]
MSRQSVFILGSGCFGRRAFSLLQQRFQLSGITVVDIQYHKLKKIAAQGGRTIVMDAVSFLASSKEKIGSDDWIVPAIPIHVAFEWIRQALKSEKELKTIPVPYRLEAMLPNPIRGTEGQLYVSNTDFICPDDCPEPETYCTVTGKPRPQVLCELLYGPNLPDFHSICVVSSQLAPGVGGFQMRTLQQALKGIRSHPGNILISTACKCHGVVHAFHID